MPTIWKKISDNWRKFRKNKLGILGLVIVLGFAIMAVFAQYIAPYNPELLSSWYIAPSFTPPGWMRLFYPSIPASHFYGLLGTDNIGRDVFSEIVWGSQVSLLVGVVSALVTVTIGLFIGVYSGYLGGRTDNVLMRITDVFLSLPGLPLIVVLLSILGRGLWSEVALIGMLSWTLNARTIRSQILTLKERPFIKAARAVGASDNYIVFRHLIPSVTPILLTNAILLISAGILTEAAISFIGLGNSQIISWGTMLFYVVQSNAVLVGSWWFFLPPGLMIVLISAGFIFIAQAIDEVVNPKLGVRIIK